MDISDSMMTAKPITSLLNGGFGDCAVSGQSYEDKDGTRFWDVTIVSAANYRSSPEQLNIRCLIVGDDFECAEVEILPPAFELHKGPAVSIDAEAKKGVLRVIRDWESKFGAFAPDIQGCAAFSASKDEVQSLFKAAADAHLRELSECGEPIPATKTTEIPGLSIGVPFGAITLEWTAVEFPANTAAQLSGR